jgi:hypothetical protein
MNLDLIAIRYPVYKNHGSLDGDGCLDKIFLFNPNRDTFQRFINRVLNCMLSLTLIVLISGVNEHTAHAESKVSIIKGDEWSYFKGEKMPPHKWNHLGFDDTTWQRGRSQFGYGSDRFETLLSDMRGNYSTLYVRREFTVNPSKIKRINLSIVCNGPFMAYINGIEVARSKTRLTEPIDISGFVHELLPGKNVLAIECSNDDINSNSFQFSPFLEILGK